MCLIYLSITFILWSVMGALLYLNLFLIISLIVKTVCGCISVIKWGPHSLDNTVTFCHYHVKYFAQEGSLIRTIPRTIPAWLYKYICTAFRQYSFFISIFGRTILPIFDTISMCHGRSLWRKYNMTHEGRISRR